jgi:hypothetical protein
MIAYANPHPERVNISAWREQPKLSIGPKQGWADGYGLIRFQKTSKQVTFECWPRFSDVTQPDAKQFPGWPVTIGL